MTNYKATAIIGTSQTTDQSKSCNQRSSKEAMWEGCWFQQSKLESLNMYTSKVIKLTKVS